MPIGRDFTSANIPECRRALPGEIRVLLDFTVSAEQLNYSSHPSGAGSPDRNPASGRVFLITLSSSPCTIVYNVCGSQKPAFIAAAIVISMLIWKFAIHRKAS